MQLTPAQQAALPGLLAMIAGMQQVVTAIQALVNDKTALLSGSFSVSTAAAGNAELQLPPMTAEESAPAFAMALGVYQVRLKVLIDQLAAL